MSTLVWWTDVILTQWIGDGGMAEAIWLNYIQQMRESVISEGGGGQERDRIILLKRREQTFKTLRGKKIASLRGWHLKWLFLKHNSSSHSAVWPVLLICDGVNIYIYIYAFGRRFYPKRLTAHSGYKCIVRMCVPWEFNPRPLRCLRNALPLSHKNTKRNK